MFFSGSHREYRGGCADKDGTAINQGKKDLGHLGQKFTKDECLAECREDRKENVFATGCEYKTFGSKCSSHSLTVGSGTGSGSGDICFVYLGKTLSNTPTRAQVSLGRAT